MFLGVSSWSSWADCKRYSTVWRKTRTRRCIHSNLVCSDVLSQTQTCSFDVFHGESSKASISVPAHCTDCGQRSSNDFSKYKLWDNESRSPSSSYGTGEDTRTVWIRQIFKLNRFAQYKIAVFVLFWANAKKKFEDSISFARKFFFDSNRQILEFSRLAIFI